MIPSGILETILLDNGEEFLSNCFTLLCARLEMTDPTMNVIYTQTNGQVKRYNSTLVSQVWLYIADNL